MTIPSRPLESTTHVSGSGRLTHDGPCGDRVPCWRAACRRSFGPYRTVELLFRANPPDPGIDIVAYCHRDKVRADALHPVILAAIAARATA